MRLTLPYNEKPIGSGSYGSVYACEYGSQQCAVKVLSMRDTDTTVRDTIFLCLLQNACVPKLLRVGIISPGQIGLVMELCYKMKRSVVCTNHIFAATRSVHAQGVIHRDIGPSNVMRTRNNKVLLIDFGLASFSCGRGCRTAMTSHVTTIITRAPELVTAASSLLEYGKEIDVWSAGVTAMWYAGIVTFRGVLNTHAYTDNVLDVILKTATPEFQDVLQSRTLPVAPLEDLDIVALPVHLCKDELTLSCTDADEFRPCENHTDMSEVLLSAFKDYIFGHTKCVQERTRALCAQICDGRCLLINAVSFCIVVCINQHFSFRQPLVEWTNETTSGFLSLTSIGLMRAVRNLSWLTACPQ
jgi:hypothetical protein